MALREGGECFTKWTHVERGKDLSRRLHRIVLQSPDGNVKTITGDDLPDSIKTSSEHVYFGVTIGQALDSSKLPSQRVLELALRLPALDGWWLPRKARSRLAAIRQAVESSTRLDHVENGPPMHRRVRRIEIQTRRGLFAFTGKLLPEYIGICTGPGFKGNHVATILCTDESAFHGIQGQSFPAAAPAAWPELRDVVHMALGLAGFLLIRFLLNLITGMA
jgi:hypothetical protein